MPMQILVKKKMVVLFPWFNIFFLHGRESVKNKMHSSSLHFMQQTLHT